MATFPGWHPRHLAYPTEWLIQVPGQPEPYAVIRILKIDGRPVYRAVTWARTSGGRQLIGYYRTGDDAAVACWRKYVDDNATRHEQASRVHGGLHRTEAQGLPTRVEEPS